MRKLFVFRTASSSSVRWREDERGEEINWHFVALKLFGWVYKSKWCIFHSRNSRRPTPHTYIAPREDCWTFNWATAAAGAVLLAWEGTCAWMKCVHLEVGGECESEVKATNVKVPEQTTENIIHIAQESHKLLLVLSLFREQKGREKRNKEIIKTN